MAEAVARYLFKLMAYKDEYEVARLYSDGAFCKQVQASSAARICACMCILRRRCLRAVNKATGEPKKMTFGPWMFPVFGLLAKFKFLRGTAFDPFGYSRERKTERALIARLRGHARRGARQSSTPDNHHIAVGLAAIPEKIRGFGHVKMRHLAAAKADEAALLEQFRAGRAPLLRAAE